MEAEQLNQIAGKLANLRERNGFEHHKTRSIGARLPRWMTAAKRREDILKAIGKLRSK